MNTRPTLTLILRDRRSTAARRSSRAAWRFAPPGVQNYTVALATFTLQTPCGYASAAAALPPASPRCTSRCWARTVQYVTGTPPDYPNGLNVGRSASTERARTGAVAAGQRQAAGAHPAPPAPVSARGIARGPVRWPPCYSDTIGLKPPQNMAPAVEGHLLSDRRTSACAGSPHEVLRDPVAVPARLVDDVREHHDLAGL